MPDRRTTKTTVHGERPAVFLDRDGVIIGHRHDYVRSLSQVRFLPGALEAVAEHSQLGWPMVIVTNQSCIGRGLVGREVVDEINALVVDAVEARGGRIDAVIVCPHHPQDRCGCRKPRPGMLADAAARLSIDLGRSYMVGDNITDLEAGKAAGTTPILVRTGLGSESETLLLEHGFRGTPVRADLSDALAHIRALSVLAEKTGPEVLETPPAPSVL